MAPSTKIRQFVRSNGIGLAAVDLALGGTALALPGKNSVNSGDIAKGQVKAGDIGSGQIKRAELAGDAVTSAKVANGSVTGADVANGSLSGDDIDDGTLAPVWSALTGVPAGCADGTDDTGGTATDVNCTGCVGAIDIGNGQVGPAARKPERRPRCGTEHGRKAPPNRRVKRAPRGWPRTVQRDPDRIAG